MSRMKLSAAVSACALVLVGCGGGGGDSGGGGNPGNGSTVVTRPDQSWLQVTPLSVDLVTYQGESRIFFLDAVASKPIERVVNAAIVDSKGVISTNVEIKSTSAYGYTAVLQTSSALAVGTHTTTLELRICEDDPRICKTPLSGSPWQVPLKVTVNAAASLSALRILPGVQNWGTFQGNAAHTGYIPASFDASKIARRWALPATTASDQVTPVVHENGRAFFIRGDRYVQSATVFAYSEDTGKELWRAPLNSLYRAAPPAAASGKLYVSASFYDGASMLVYDQASGTAKARVNTGEQLSTSQGPTAAGDSVYVTSGDSTASLSRFHGDTATETWRANIPGAFWWTPAVDGTYAYGYLNRSLYAVSLADGGTAFTIRDPDSQWAGAAGRTAALGQQRAFVVEDGRLMAFDLAARSRAWSVAADPASAVGVAKDIVYVFNPERTGLNAHSAATGALLWSSERFDSYLGDRSGSVVVTNNLVFASTDFATVAIDLASHRVVWKYPLGGAISISDRGVLYIAGTDGSVVAVNLQ